ncbi:MAG: hypothetical protein ABIN01_23875 [Ferruginibacter sp.]
MFYKKIKFNNRSHIQTQDEEEGLTGIKNFMDASGVSVITGDQIDRYLVRLNKEI